MAVNTKAYLEAYLKIRGKDGRLLPLHLNGPQQKLYAALAAQYKAGKPMRAIVLKARQMGFSTLTEGLLFKRTATRFHARSGIVAHTDEAAAGLFSIAKRMYAHLPASIRPRCTSNSARALAFGDLDSSIRVMTAGGEGVGRSDTFQNLHISEYAFWPGDKEATLLGLLQAVPSAPDTMVIIESTANGYEAFQKRWAAAVAGESDFAPVFCAWWEQPEYRRRADGFVPTRAERVLQQRYGLDDEQLSWRRWCIRNACGGDERLFRQEYPSCPEEAFLTTGDCVFQKDALLARLARAPEPLVMRLDECITKRDGRDVLQLAGVCQDPDGGLNVYERPKPGVPYVIGADTAGDGSDWFVAQVLDNTTGRQVATLRRHYDEDAFARQCMCLGYWYNTALLGIEVNFSTFPIKECQRLGYPRLYTRETEDRYTLRYEKRYGFRTTALTRPLLVAGLVQQMNLDPDSVSDKTTLREMLSFVKNERGRAEALAGEHDDCVMALAIAHYIRPQQAYTPEGETRRDPGLESFLNYG